MRQTRFPLGWDEERARKILTHYEEQTKDEAVAEDEVAFEVQEQTIMVIPKELVPEVRLLSAKNRQ